jgi:hypothetical protein
MSALGRYRTFVRAIVTIALATASISAVAEPTGSQDGFTATIMLTKKPEEFVREWATSKESRVPASETSGVVRVGEYIAAVVFFRGCKETTECRVHVDYELVAPDGSVRHRVPDRDGTDQPGARNELSYLSHAIVRFQFTPRDVGGPYTINAVVREPARGLVVRVSQQFRVAE